MPDDVRYYTHDIFIVDKIIRTRSLPDKFIIRGAGWGHGVGMCQTGAAIMALEGKDYKTILRHYYRGTKIMKLY